MMIGVAQVIGMKPTASLVFSSGPDCAKASVAVAIGKICASAAETVALPTAVSSERRVIASGKAALQHRALDPSAQAGIAQAFAGEACVMVHAAGAGSAEIAFVIG